MSSTMLTERPRVATEDDLLRALIALGALPRHRDIDAEVALAAYRVSLEDGIGLITVAACDLATAVRRILQGALGHAFHPTPPELRMQCDRARDARSEVAARMLRAQRMRDERAAHGPVERTVEEKARAKAIYEKFCRGWAEARLEQRTGGGPELLT